MRFYNRQHRHYCGIDLHVKTMYVCILDAAGDTLSVELSAGRWLALKNPHGIVEFWDLPARKLVGRLSTGMTRG